MLKIILKIKFKKSQKTDFEVHNFKYTGSFLPNLVVLTPCVHMQWSLQNVVYYGSQTFACVSYYYLHLSHLYYYRYKIFREYFLYKKAWVFIILFFNSFFNFCCRDQTQSLCIIERY